MALPKCTLYRRGGDPVTAPLETPEQLAARLHPLPAFPFVTEPTKRMQDAALAAIRARDEQIRAALEEEAEIVSNEAAVFAAVLPDARVADRRARADAIRAFAARLGAK